MSRTYLNYELPTSTIQRHNRREKFRQRFTQCPNGLLDLDRLAEETKIPWRTIVAYMQELQRLGYAVHKTKRYGRFYCQIDLRMWWKIK